MGLLVIVAVLLCLALYGISKLIKWIVKNRIACPDCEGKGYWYGMRERELCKTCNGTGRRKR